LQGGHFRIKNLSDGAISTLELPQMTCSVLSKKEDLVYKKNTYWKPKSRTYPAIDAFISLPSSINWDVCALQMTVSDNHGVIRHYVEDTLCQLGISKQNTKNKRRFFPLFFAVPVDKFENFPPQKYLTDKREVVKTSCALVDDCVKQFALEITHTRRQ
jgi:hypothetical protein